MFHFNYHWQRLKENILKKKTIILGPGIQPPGQRLAATETETSSSMMSSEIESSIYESEDVQSQGKTRLK